MEMSGRVDWRLSAMCSNHYADHRQRSVSRILWPLRTSAAPLAATGAAYCSALPLPLASLVVNYLWVLQAETAFEERAA